MKKTALITGASSGIGKELARIHAKKGGNLVIVARSKDKLENLKTELETKYSVSVYTIAKDLTKQKAPQEVYSEIIEKGIKIDYLINNAGFGGRGKFHERDWQTDLEMINLNIVALTSLTRFFLPDFVKRNEGKILNVSSIAAFVPGPLQAVYYATKSFVTSFSNALAEELHDTNITVTALMPGSTETGFAKTADMDKTSFFDKTVTAESVAIDGYNAMIKGKLDILSGVSFGNKIMMALLPFLPKRMILKTIRVGQEV